MRISLHILTKPDDALAASIIALQREKKDSEIRVRDLTAGQVDYKELLENIFEADAIQAW